MAYRRSLTTRGSIIARRYYPSFYHINVHHEDEPKIPSMDDDLFKQKVESFFQCGSSISSFNKSAGFSAFVHDRRRTNIFFPSSAGSSFCRYMSTGTATGEGSEKIELIRDVAEVLSESSFQAAASQVAEVSEVAIAAADSFFTVKAMQYLIDGVHTFTGLNWWAAIAITTLLIKGATVPLMINKMKFSAKLSLLKLHLEEVKKEMEENSMDPAAVAEGRKKISNLVKEYGVSSPLTSMTRVFILGSVFISFILAILNMAEKVPSFKHGGAYWFVDLTTPDSLYIFPVLTALTFWINEECNLQKDLESNFCDAGVMKNASMGVAVASFLFNMIFPKAIFFYFVTIHFFSLCYGLVLKDPGVRKFLGIPDVPVSNQKEKRD